MPKTQSTKPITTTKNNSFVRVLKKMVSIRVKLKRLLYKRILRSLLFTSRIGRKAIFGHIGKGLFVDYIYEMRPSGYTRFGQFMDRIVLMLPAVRATRFKFEKLSDLLRSEISKNSQINKTTKIVDLGSGPARYLVRVAKKEKYQRKDFQAVCLDIDKTSLRIGKQIGKGLPIEYRVGNINQLGCYKRFADKKRWEPNLVIISTCYDFLDDSATRKSLEELYHSLEPGGTVVIVSQIRNPNGHLLKGIKFPDRGANGTVHYREPFVVKKWMQESGYKDIGMELDQWGMYCFYTGKKIGDISSANKNLNIPIFLKGRMYKRVIDMRSNDAYQYMRGFRPSGNGQGFRGNQPVILMAINDYLGLRVHPKVIQAIIGAAKKYGASTTSSRILAGNIELHEELQSKLSSFLNLEDVLIFSSGYAANTGVVAAILGKSEVAIVDRYAHASLLDGCKLSEGITRFFAHNSIPNLEKLLEEHKGANKLIICDGIYSMDGDLAHLPDIFRLAEQYDAGLLLDDGHATGVFGAKGRGTLEHFNIRNKERCLLIGSLGKALGSTGGFVAGNREVIDYLRHTTRSLLFSTGLPPVCAAAAIAALEIIQDEPWLIQQLWSNTWKMRQGLTALGYDIGTSISPLIPIIIGDEYKVYKMSVALEEAGVVIDGVAPPAVKQNQCRLRIKMMATHTDTDIATALELLKKIGRRFGAI